MICFCNSNEVLYVSVAQIHLEMQKCMNTSISSFHINVKNWGIFIQKITLTLIELHKCTKLIVILEKNHFVHYLDNYINFGSMVLEMVSKMSVLFFSTYSLVIQCYLFENEQYIKNLEYFRYHS